MASNGDLTKVFIWDLIIKHVAALDPNLQNAKKGDLTNTQAIFEGETMNTWWLIPVSKWVITPVIYMGFL